MRVPLALAFLLLAGSLAGCSSLGSDGPAVGSARDWQGAADRSAHKWAQDAVLMSASASELDDAARADFADGIADAKDEVDEMRKDGDLPEEAEDEITAFFDVADIVAKTHDPKAGDGKATAWAYVYAADSRAGEVDVIMVARGHVAYHSSNEDGLLEEFHEVGFDGALGNWSVDSDEAAQAAGVGDEAYAAVCGLTNVIVNFSLQEGDDGESTLWSVWAEADDDEAEVDEAQVAIDANTGSIVVDETVEPVIDILLQEMGGEDGTFTGSVQVTQGTSFDVFNAGHQQLVVEYSTFPAPPQPITITVTDPNGTATSFDVGLEETPFFAVNSVTLTDVPVGEYQVSMSAPLAVYSQWSLSWCTDGTTPKDAEFQFACDQVEQGSGSSSGGPAPGPWTLGETLSRLHRWAATWES